MATSTPGTAQEVDDQRRDHAQTTRAASGRHESESERLDRNLSEMLQELRVAMPGVQVLFAFLLTVPFQQRFAKATNFQEVVYLVTLLATGLASVLLMAPSAHHRITFRQQEKEEVVTTGNRLVIAGLVALAVAMTGSVLLVTDFLFDQDTTVVATVGLGIVFAAVWFLKPLAVRGRSSGGGR